MKKILLILLIQHALFASGRGVVSFTGRKFLTTDNVYQKSTELLTDFRVEESRNFFGFDFKLNVIGKIDQEYKESSLLDANEAYLAYEWGNLLVTAGYQIFNWSDLESFHPADIVNSRIIDSDVEAIKKRGELALNLSMLTDVGIFKAYLFPKVKGNYFPDKNSRVSDNIRPVDKRVVKKSEVTDSLDHMQYGFGYENSFDDLELKVNILKSINRSFSMVGYESYIVNSPVSITPTSDLAAFYFDSLNFTTSGTYFFGEQTFKFEYIYSSPENKEFSILSTNGIIKNIDRSLLALGYEYQYVHGNGFDSMFFLEYQRALKGSEEVVEEFYIFQNDLFLGHRLSFNDAYGMELFSGLFYDLSRSEMLYLINFSRRINDNWKAKVGYRGYNISESDKQGLTILENDDEIYFTLLRYF